MTLLKRCRSERIDVRSRAREEGMAAKKKILLDYNLHQAIEVMHTNDPDEPGYPFYFYVNLDHQASSRMTREQMIQLRDSLNELLEA
jgi:hypothetical protein